MATSTPNTLWKRFTPEEDAIILKLIAAKVPTWEDFCPSLPGRTARQIRDRYNTKLSMNVVNKKWTDIEDQIIIQKYHEIGARWTSIAKFLQGRSGNDVKNRWYKVISKREKNLTTIAPNPRRKKSEIQQTPCVDYDSSANFSFAFDNFEYDQLNFECDALDLF